LAVSTILIVVSFASLELQVETSHQVPVFPVRTWFSGLLPLEGTLVFSVGFVFVVDLS
jgi:hypothetical protein